MARIAVVGAGAWGSALAVPLRGNQHQVALWSRDRKADPEAGYVDSLAEAVAGAELILLSPASVGLRAVCQQLKPLLPQGAALLSVTKGIEPETYLTMSQVILSELPEAAGRLAVLSGPNFAHEVAQRLPTGTVVAAKDPDLARWIQGLFTNKHFRVYTNPDVTGVELGGALKNVIAIGVGISDGLKMGENARATLITRGIAEMTRLGKRLGAQSLTFAGLSGMGDLVLTCTGASRNRAAGLALGQGEPLEAFLARTGATVEGVPTAKAAWGLAQRLGVRMPITEVIHSVLFEGVPPSAGLSRLMEREARGELEEWSGSRRMAYLRRRQ